MSRRRTVLAAAVMVGALVAGPAPVARSAPPLRPALPAGFTTSNVASVASPTAVEAMPDGSVVVLQQNGPVRVLVDGNLVPAPAIVLSVCLGAERGLLGFTPDPDFASNRHVFIYYTRTQPGAPGGCVNRVSRFTMPTATTIDPASELVLVDHISSVGGNHNAGDVEVGRDGFLYITTGDAGSDPRGDSGGAGANDAAQDLSLLNGKVLRVDRTTGEGAPGNPFPLGGGGTSCRVRGNTASTPTTPCAEIYAWGLRNPYRFAFDPNGAAQRFFINDVGQSSREEVNEGGVGRNYGWNAREGQCPRGQHPPCAGPPPDVTDPITDYPRTVGTYITAGAFIPNGVWTSEFDGGYLFADAGSGKVFLRRADGSVDYANPFATAAGQVGDMAFVRENGATVLYFTVARASTDSVRRIVGVSPAVPPPAPRAPLQYLAAVPSRLLDTRSPALGGGGPFAQGESRVVSTGTDGTMTPALLVNLVSVTPHTDGFLTAWAAGAPRPPTANVNATAGAVVSNLAVVPLDSEGRMQVFAHAGGDVVIDIIGRFVFAPDAVSEGRFVAVDPTRLADSREPVGPPSNQYSRVPSAPERLEPGSPYPRVRVPVLGRGGVPATGVSSVVLVVTALARSGTATPGGFVTATSGGASWPGTANVNTTGYTDIRANTVVVPVGPNGDVDLHLMNVDHVVVDVVGWFTDWTTPASTSGRFVSLTPTREADSRAGLGFARLPAGGTRTLDPVSVPADASAMVHNIAIVNNDGPGFVTPHPAGPVPFVAAGNVTAPNQVRSIHTVTKLGSGGVMSYFSYMATDLVVDVTGYFTR
jgi:glucose/arabinose dehydrogenase